jgi:hypothetical protein
MIKFINRGNILNYMKTIIPLSIILGLSSGLFSTFSNAQGNLEGSPIKQAVSIDRERFEGIPVELVSHSESVSEQAQSIYDILNESNLAGRKYSHACVGMDTITAALADRLGNNDLNTSYLEAIDLAQRLQEGENGNKGIIYVPVVGYNPEKNVRNIPTPSNNPLDWIIAGQEGDTKRVLNLHNPREALSYVEEGLTIKKGIWGEINDSEGFIAIQCPSTQPNGPAVVTAYYRPHSIENGRIVTLEKIIPAQYQLRAVVITPTMTLQE